MSPDRHIYLATALLAVVFATAISVLAPRDPFAGTTIHRETTEVSRTTQAGPSQAVGVSASNPAAQQRVGTSL